MQGLPGADIRTTVEGMAPKLDVFLNGSTVVNLGRAEQCGSVASAPPPTSPPEPAAWDIHRLTPAEVKVLRAASAAHPEPPEVDFSLFVQLQQDLDPEVRAQAVAAVRALSNRARFKQDAAAIEVSGANVKALHAVRGLSYVEPGEALSVPDPVVGSAHGLVAAVSVAERQVTTEARQHRYGRDVLVGIIDVGGFDFAHPDFAKRGGGTRWVAIWDQGGVARPSPAAARPSPRFDALDYGSEIVKAQMDAAMNAAPALHMAATSLEPQSAMSVGSHGTHVASIAAGNRGVARNAHLAGVLVALGSDDLQSGAAFYDSTRIVDAVDYLLALAAELGDADGPLPVSINISLGTNGHAHDSSSAVARWIDNALTAPGRCISVAAGNAGQTEPTFEADRGYVLGRIHAGGTFAGTDLRQELGWVVAGGDIADLSENEMEIWYSPQDRIEVEIRPPGRGWIGPIGPGQNIRSELLEDGTVLSVHNETYLPGNGANRISILLSPFYGPIVDGVRSVGPITAGEWKVRLTGKVVRDGRYDAWIGRDDPHRRPGSGPRQQWDFPSCFAPGAYTADRMIGSLACAERVLAVANVDLQQNAAHATSSRGPTRDGRPKPDIAADGTGVVAARGFDRAKPWIEMTGTSMASPYVCGVAALMLAIAPQLTSAQIQGLMRTTSTPLPGHDFRWRDDTGFGVIDADACVEEAVRHRQATERILL